MVKSSHRLIGSSLINGNYENVNNSGDGNADLMEGVVEGEGPDVVQFLESDYETDSEESFPIFVDSDCEDGIEKEEENCEVEGNLNEEVRHSEDAVLLTCASACFDKDSQRGFNRRCSGMTSDLREQCLKLFNYNKYNYYTCYICNLCGKKLRSNDKCCRNEIAKYIRLPFKTQLRDVVTNNFEEILTVRQGLKSGSLEHHNLSSDFLRQIWESEGDGTLRLSLIGSVDGIVLNGHTKKKLWPVTFELLDLRTANMQKAVNMMLAGVIECPKDPTTFTWNAIIDSVYADVDSSDLFYSGYQISTVIQTFIADQPNGFSFPPSELVKYLSPYDTPLDILHNGGEGLLNVVLHEMLPTDKRPRKTDFFRSDAVRILHFFSKIRIPSGFKSCSSRRNGTDKINYFRILFTNLSISGDCLEIEQKFVVLALSLIMTQLYTNCAVATDFFEDVCNSLVGFFENENEIYLSIKAHELIFHLPRIQKLFGNTAALSTFSYESFYKFIFGDSKTTITKNYVETVTTRLMLNISTRREVLRRYSNTSTQTEGIKIFVENSSDPVSTEVKMTGIVSLNSADVLAGYERLQYYANCRLPCGRLSSSYASNSSDDIIFVTDVDVVRVCRFIAATVLEENKMLLVECINEVLHEERFENLSKEVQQLEEPTRTHANGILAHLKSFGGVVHGNFSSVRLFIDVKCVLGVGTKIVYGSDYLFVQLNGCPIHA